MNAVEIEAAVSDLALQPFDGQEFPFAFLSAFGNKDTALKRLRAGNNNTSDVPGGVLQRNNIHIAVCEANTVGETLKALRASLATTKAKAKFILATDGQTLEAEELASGETIACAYADFPNHFGFLLPLAGISTIKEIKDNPIDVRATSRLNKLYVELLSENPEWAKEDRRADMNHFMARLVFCFFAEDTDIFNGNGLFTQTVQQMSERDGANTHEVLSQIFRTMNIKVADRANAQPRLPNWANSFPYVNGGLFSGSTETPRFTRMARTYLIHAGNLNWKKINPDIFGSMIQAVADDEERGSLGMHYTSVPNILKVLNPLFLDDLRGALAEAGDNERKLLNLRKRMARIRVFDPACGSGNFLVIAYKQMREIEAEINRRRGEQHLRSEIPLTNFRGIELRDFPAEIARLALIIAEFQCDVLYRGQKDALAEFLPLDAQNWIVCGNSLRLDWLAICPPAGTGVKLTSDDLFEVPQNQAEIDFANDGGETYICGNPPYLGGKKQSDEQKADMEAVFGRGSQFKNLDYIAAFFQKAASYISGADKCAFVSTSSISQGTHVPTLWPRLFSEGVSIFFCHAPFKWANNAANNAGVFVNIIGLAKSKGPLFIFDGDKKKEAQHINAYLIDGPNKIIEPESAPLSDIPKMITGNAPYDGGHLFINEGEKDEILKSFPGAHQIFRRVTGTAEFNDGVARWCIWVDDNMLEYASEIPQLRKRFENVLESRLSGGDVARTLSGKPHQFRYRHMAKNHLVLVPQISAEKRPYLPVGYLEPDFVVTHLAHCLYDGGLVGFALLSSKLHQVWLKTVAGRLGNGIRYTSNICWNTFPVPILTATMREDLVRCAENILLAREVHFPMTIADMYEPNNMPDNLRYAHARNDEVLERIYIGRLFRNDTERLEKLFELYTKMTAETAKTKPVTKAPRGKSK